MTFARLKVQVEEAEWYFSDGKNLSAPVPLPGVKWALFVTRATERFGLAIAAVTGSGVPGLEGVVGEPNSRRDRREPFLLSIRSLASRNCPTLRGPARCDMPTTGSRQTTRIHRYSYEQPRTWYARTPEEDRLKLVCRNTFLLVGVDDPISIVGAQEDWGLHIGWTRAFQNAGHLA